MTEYIGFCGPCGDSTGYYEEREDALGEIEELHDGPACRPDVAEEGDTVVLDTQECGDWKVGDWIGASDDDVVVRIDHFDFYAGFGFIGTSADGEDSVYLDTGAKLEPRDEEDDES